ncbi:hypothetical protein MTR67_014012 [Solanum verrucosum]|uniref:Membrane-associated kinase regulator 2 n=1 Tax=Solanum verrucosum TaxID=315347 RepID=A0AAF0QCZ8_SOLVR|nr:hypothetical protein MTR67_014012 [Solanum verrucosum]
METFNLLKFWRSSGTDTTSTCRDIVSEIDELDCLRNPAIETDEETDDDADSFFDLVFTGPDERPKLDNSKSVSVNTPREPESPRDSISKPQSPISILKSAPKFRVFFLGLRKTKLEKVGIDNSSPSSPKFQTQKLNLKRDNSLRSKLQSEKEEELSVDESLKKFVRVDVPKYLKLMKPLYARASKRYTDKISVSPLSSPSAQSMCSPRKTSEVKRVSSFGSVRKHLGKSRSAASTFAAGASSSPLNRRDNSLLQEQNDGIQGAILHCKRCYSSLAKSSENLARASSSVELNRWSI